MPSRRQLEALQCTTDKHYNSTLWSTQLHTKHSNKVSRASHTNLGSVYMRQRSLAVS